MRNNGALARLNLRIALCASVSVIALAVIAPEARAADVTPYVYKAPPPTPTGDFTTWVEGGAFYTRQDPIFFAVPEGAAAGLYTGISIPSSSGNNFPGIGTGNGFDPHMGGEGDIGIDYRFAGTPWHLSFEARYGAATSNGQSVTLQSTGSPPPTLWAGTSTFGEKESHAVVNLMVGHDIGGWNEIKFGLRSAYLGADVTDSLSASASTGPTCVPGSTATGPGAVCSLVSTAMLSADERSTFIGTGPRFAVEGAVPFTPSWAFQYGVGTALLIGERQLSIESASQSNCIPSSSGSYSSLCFSSGTAQIGFVGLSAIPNSGVSPTSDWTAVVNVNAMAALAYSFTPNAIFSVGYRFDGYWDSLKTVNAAGTVTDVNRMFYGPFARFTMRW